MYNPNPQDISVRWGIRVPLRDGTSLAADLYLPTSLSAVEDCPSQAAQAWPTILVRTPYGRSTQTMIEQGRYFARHGYAVLQVDVRGRGDSDGSFVPYRNEGADGYDTIEWAAEQTWCNGTVGTLGGSYLARIQWLTALHQPPHLKAMVTLVSPSDPFVEWPLGIPDPMHLSWLFMVSDRTMQNVDVVDWERVYTDLPLVTMDEETGRQIPAWREEFRHRQLDEWWKQLSYQTRFNEIDLPVLHISGWYDDEQIGTPLNFIGMTNAGKSEFARRSQRLIMGPWPHRVNQSTKLGPLDFGLQSLIDLQGEQLKFFDYWLKQQDNGLNEEAPVSLFIMGINQWRQEHEWPLARTLYTKFYLHSHGQANSLFGNGFLLPKEPEESENPSDTYFYNPENPVPFITEPTSAQIGGPDDYAPIHRRDDVLVYTTETFQEPLEITGPVQMELYAATSAPDTDFMVQLHDVWPSGYAQRLCDGMVRIRFRKGMDQPQLVEPGLIERYVIHLWNTSQVILPGHRLRVHVTSSAFPKYDRNPNTGDELGQTNRLSAARQTIFHSPEHPSALILPVIPNG